MIVELISTGSELLLGDTVNTNVSWLAQELNKLGLEFSRYKERWDKLSRSIETVNKDVENIHITTDKISKRFESISSVDIKNNQFLE